MLVELLVIGTISYVSGRGAAQMADETLRYVETRKRVSAHKFGGQTFVVHTNDEYRQLKAGVAAIKRLIKYVKADLNFDEDVEACYKLAIVEGIIQWGICGDPSYSSLVQNLPPSHHAEYVGATKKAWIKLSNRQVGAMFCLAHFYSPAPPKK